MKKLIFVFIAFLSMMTACNREKDTERITIASETGECIGVMVMDCYLIKREGNTDWELFYEQIEGFNYVSGHEYVIEMKKEKIDNPPMDRSAFRYKLVKEISKEKKESENLPY